MAEWLDSLLQAPTQEPSTELPEWASNIARPENKPERVRQADDLRQHFAGSALADIARPGTPEQPNPVVHYDDGQTYVTGGDQGARQYARRHAATYARQLADTGIPADEMTRRQKEMEDHTFNAARQWQLEQLTNTVGKEIPAHAPLAYMPFGRTAVGIIEASNLKAAKERFGNGEATQRDYELMAQEIGVGKREAAAGLGQKALEAGGGLLPLAAEWMATGAGLGKLGLGAVEKAALGSLKLGQTGVKATAVRALIGGTARTAANPAAIAELTLQRMVPQLGQDEQGQLVLHDAKPLTTAAANALTDKLIENVGFSVGNPLTRQAGATWLGRTAKGLAWGVTTAEGVQTLQSAARLNPSNSTLYKAAFADSPEEKQAARQDLLAQVIAFGGFESVMHLHAAASEAYDRLLATQRSVDRQKYLDSLKEVVQKQGPIGEHYRAGLQELARRQGPVGVGKYMREAAAGEGPSGTFRQDLAGPPGTPGAEVTPTASPPPPPPEPPPEPPRWRLRPQAPAGEARPDVPITRENVDAHQADRHSIGLPPATPEELSAEFMANPEPRHLQRARDLMSRGAVLSKEDLEDQLRDKGVDPESVIKRFRLSGATSAEEWFKWARDKKAWQGDQLRNEYAATLARITGTTGEVPAVSPMRPMEQARRHLIEVEGRNFDPKALREATEEVLRESQAAEAGKPPEGVQAPAAGEVPPAGPADRGPLPPEGPPAEGAPAAQAERGPPGAEPRAADRGVGREGGATERGAAGEAAPAAGQPAGTAAAEPAAAGGGVLEEPAAEAPPEPPPEPARPRRPSIMDFGKPKKEPKKPSGVREIKREPSALERKLAGEKLTEAEEERAERERIEREGGGEYNPGAHAEEPGVEPRSIRMARGGAETSYAMAQGAAPGGPAPGAATPGAVPTPAPPARSTGVVARLALAQRLQDFFGFGAAGPGDVGGAGFRAKLGQLAREKEIAQVALAGAEKYLERYVVRAPDEATREARFLELTDAIENDDIKSLPPELQDFANAIRKINDKNEADLLQRGLLKKTLANYLGHLWADPNNPNASPEEIGATLAARRPLAGSESYKRQRKYGTFREGIDAGLVPKDWNLARMVLAKHGEVRKSIMAHDTIEEHLKPNGWWEFRRLGQRPPEGFEQINDKIAKVFAPPEVNLTEYYDKQQMEGLEDFAKSLGIKLERVMKGGKPEIMGQHTAGSIVTKFGTPEEVLAHEIGHELDQRYNLKALIQDSIMGPELRKLADLRADGKASQAFKDYIRSGPEKIANLVAAFQHAPDLLKQEAPNLAMWFDRFLANHKELAPLRDIKPSLELGLRQQAMRLAGPMLTGGYWTPEPMAKILNNYVSPGLWNLRGSGVEGAIGGAYRALRWAGNLLNNFQLGFSFFHGGFVTADTITSSVALAAQEISRGQFARGIARFAMSPTSVFRNYIQGNKLLQEYYKPGSVGGEYADLVDRMVEAGGRARMDAFLGGDHLGKLNKAFEDVKSGKLAQVGGLLWHAAPALSEAFSYPIMQKLVPRVKMGVFIDMARSEMDRLGPNVSDVARRASMQRIWDSVDNRLGQMVYDNLFLNHVVKDALMLGVRSVGWNIGTFRELGYGLKDIPKSLAGIAKGEGITERAAYLIALPTVTAAVGGLINYLYTGQLPQEWRDYIFPRTGRTRKDGTADRLSLPTYMRDVGAATNRAAEGPFRIMSNLATMAGHKVNPVFSTIIETLENQDYYGTAIRNWNDPVVRQMADEARHIAGAVVPLGIRGFMQQRETGASLGQAALSEVGITPAPGYITKTDKQQLQAEMRRKVTVTPLYKLQRQRTSGVR